MYIYIYTYVYMYIYKYVCIYIYVKHVHICIYVDININIHIYTYLKKYFSAVRVIKEKMKTISDIPGTHSQMADRYRNDHIEHLLMIKIPRNNTKKFVGVLGIRWINIRCSSY